MPPITHRYRTTALTLATALAITPMEEMEEAGCGRREHDVAGGVADSAAGGLAERVEVW